jgi:hypothetical protein
MCRPSTLGPISVETSAFPTTFGAPVSQDSQRKGCARHRRAQIALIDGPWSLDSPCVPGAFDGRFPGVQLHDSASAVRRSAGQRAGPGRFSRAARPRRIRARPTREWCGLGSRRMAMARASLGLETRRMGHPSRGRVVCGVDHHESLQWPALLCVGRLAWRGWWRNPVAPRAHAGQIALLGRGQCRRRNRAHRPGYRARWGKRFGNTQLSDRRCRQPAFTRIESPAPRRTRCYISTRSRGLRTAGIVGFLAGNIDDRAGHAVPYRTLVLPSHPRKT